MRLATRIARPDPATTIAPPPFALRPTGFDSGRTRHPTHYPLAIAYRHACRASITPMQRALDRS